MRRMGQPLKTGEKILFGVAGAFVAFAVVAFIILQFVAAKSEKPLFEAKTHANLSPLGHKGEELFRVRGCTECHRALRMGTNVGGPGSDLDGEGSRRSYDWILAFLKDPERTYGAPTLDHGPRKQAEYVMKLPHEEQVAIATFLSELKAEQGSSAAPVPPEANSPFIDTMVRTFAPESWKQKYKDIREELRKQKSEGNQR